MNKKLISLLIALSITASHAVAFAQADLAKEDTIASQTQTDAVVKETISDISAQSAEDTEIPEQPKAEKTILATEDFSSGLADWKVISGIGYSIKNGALQFKNTGTSQQTSLILSKEISVENADIEFDVKYKNGVYFGVAFRADKDQSMYVLRFYKKTGKATLLKRVKGGDLVQIKSVDSRLKSDEASRVGIRLASRQIIVRVDGINIMNIEDASISEGYIGFDGYSAEATVDNIEVFRYGTVEYDKEYPTEKKETRVIYVAAEGETSGDGSYERPYVGVQKAIEAARQAKRGNFPVNVIFKEGRYQFDNTIELTDADSGTEAAPITYMAEEGAHVEFTGAQKFDATRFKPVTDPDVIRRLHNNAKGKVYQMKFTDSELSTTLTNFGKAHLEGTGGSSYLPAPAIYLNNNQQSLAKWPNGNFAIIEDSVPGKDAAKTGDTENPGAISFTNTEPSRWLEAVEEGHVFAEGMFGVFWSGETIPVDRIDMNENKIWLKYAALYTVLKDHRYYIKNLIEEMDIPGEYYIDFDKRTLYLYPTEELTKGTDFEIATLEMPMFKLEGTKNIIFDGIHFTKTAMGSVNGNSHREYGGTAVLLKDTRNITVKNCMIDKISYDGILMMSGIGLNVEGCIIDDIGFTGVHIYTAGDRPTLTPSEVVIKNNIFSSTQRETPISSQAAVATGAEGLVGTVEMEISNNIFHNTRGLTVLYYGNGNVIKHNEFSSVVNSAADMGAIYVGRSFVDHGNVVYQNYFHDIGIKNSTSGHPAMGIYWDDEITGQSAIQNIIVANGYNNIANVHISGFDHTFTGNTMVNSDRGFIYSQRRAYPGYDYEGNSQPNKHTWKWEWTGIPVTSDLFKERYPKMASTFDRLMGEWGSFMHLDSVVSNNLLVNVGKDSVHENAYTHSEMEGNVNMYYSEEPTDKGNIKGCTNYYGNGEIDESMNYEIFVDPDNHDWRVKDEAREKYGISDEVLGEEFDMDIIGLQNGLTLPEGSEEFDLLFPTNGLTGIQTKDVTFAWTRADGADEYTIQVAEDPNFENIVYEESLVYTATYPSQLQNSKTYYWRVTAKNLSKQIGFENTSEVWSFTTAAQDELDYSLLDSKIKYAENVLKTMVEGNEMDQYIPGTSDKIKAAVKKAQEFKATGKGTQKDVEAQTEEITLFLAGLESYINAGYITLDFDEAEIIEGLGDGEIQMENGVVKYTSGPTKHASVYYDKVLSNSSVLKFKTRIDSFGDAFVSYGLRAENYGTYTYGQDCYYMIIKEDKIELQRQGAIFRTVPNDFFKVGEWVDMELAVITTAGGAHVFWKANGHIVFDYLETASPKTNPGSFMVFVPKGGVTMELAPADEVPTGLFQRSEEIQQALDEGTITYDVFDTRFTEDSGTWSIHPTLKGKNGEYVKTSKDAGASATWNVLGEAKYVGKESFKISYYHVPSPNADKNVKIKLSNYFGSYETTIDLSQGEEGWVDIGGMKLVSASNTSEGTISFIGSGNGEVNVSRVRIQYVEGEKDLIGK